jgi:protein-tyrosine phosphatase
MESVVTHVSLERQDGALVVSWTVAGDDPAVDIAVGPTPETVDHEHTVTVADGTRAVLRPGGPGRTFVSVSPHRGGGALVAGERRLPFVGVTNFRDLGGYAVAGGGHTRWGLVFRADALHRFTDADLEGYHQLGLRAVYDLRGDAERDLHPNPFPSVQLALISQPPEGAPEPDPAGLPSDAAGGERRLRELYGNILATGAPRFGELLGSLARPDGLPAVFHCTGGKDRTGLSAALLLELLGVSREHVLDDYELTSRYRLREHQTESYENLLATGMAPEAAAAVLGAPRWAMEGALDELDRDYGGAQAYLRGPAGLDAATVERLRQLLIRHSPPPAVT